MYLFTIPLLLFSNSIQISITEQVLTPQNTRKFSGNYDECVCFPAGQSLVPELLHPKSNGLERLVIFLYKDVNTNQIRMFLPSPEKQPLIPNIPFEVGDVLRTITTETVASLFPTNLNNRFNGDQMLTDSLPIGLKWGTIEHSVSPNPNTVGVPQGYPQQTTSQQIYSPNIFGPNERQNVVLPNNGAYIEVIPTNPNIFTPEPKNPYQPYSEFGTYKKTLPIPPGVSVPTNRYNQPDVYAPGGSSTPGHLTFDLWFIQQMLAFQDAKSPADIQTINTDMLRSLVQKALFENHMHIGSTGLITDANGALINLNNLQLRPILIGNPVDYKQALTGEQQIALPKHLPYLEGILITLEYPPKILGVIPLGKIYVSQNPQQSPRGALIEHFYTESDTASKFISGPGRTNLLPGTAQQKQQWTNADAVYTGAGAYQMGDVPVPPSSQYPNMELRFTSGGANIPYSNPTNAVYANNFDDPEGSWKRRSSNNKDKRPPKQKVKDTPEQSKSKETNSTAHVTKKKSKPRSKSWFKKLFGPSRSDSRNGRKSGSRFYENWQSPSNSEWEVHSVPQGSPYSMPPNGDKSHLTVRSFNDPWRSASSSNSDITFYQDRGNSPQSWSYSSNSGPNNYKPNYNVDPQQNVPSLNAAPISDSVPSKSWPSNVGLTAAPYEISRPNPTNPSYQTANWNYLPSSDWGSQSNVGSSWQTVIATTSYPLISSSPVRSPYLRSEPDSPKIDAPTKVQIPLENISKVQPVTVLKPVVSTPIISYRNPQEGGTPTNFSDFQTQYKIAGSEAVENQTKSLSGRRQYSIPMIQGVIKTLINMVLQNLSQADGGSGSSSDGGGRIRTTITEEPSNDSSINHIEKSGAIGEEEERPDFRIIGGSAATGSGSPLSNKGRSGLSAA